jgi:hypothetical protein
MDRISPTIGAGLSATAALTAATYAGNRLGVTRLDFPTLLGTMVTRQQPAARRLGWGLHALNGVALAAAYRELMNRTSVPKAGWSGALVGLAHGVLSLAFMGAAPKVHPRPFAGGVRPVSATAYGPGWIPGMLLGHALYGAVVGSCLSKHD